MECINREKKNHYYLLCALSGLLGLVACVLFLMSDLGLTRIPISDYLLISLGEDGEYSYSIDKHRIKKTFYFPEETSLPENRALESLSLLVSSSYGTTGFEVASYLDNARQLLKEGGYAISNTVWTWKNDQIKSQYSKLLSVQKTISLKDFALYYSDGNGNWMAQVDYDSLITSIGDRIIYDSRLKSAITSLSFSLSPCGDGSYKIETWSAFSSEQGVSVEKVLNSGGISMEDTVFIISESDILNHFTRTLRLQTYCVLREAQNGIRIDIDKASILQEYSFQQGSDAAKAIEAISLNAVEEGNGFRVTVCSNASDIDIIKTLLNNGVKLTDTDFFIQK